MLTLESLAIVWTRYYLPASLGQRTARTVHQVQFCYRGTEVLPASPLCVRKLMKVSGKL